jgi:hypothetical protein
MREGKARYRLAGGKELRPVAGNGEVEEGNERKMHANGYCLGLQWGFTTLRAPAQHRMI